MDKEAALRTAVQTYSDAFLTGDASTAYAIFTERCQDRVGDEEFASIAEAAADQYGEALPFESYSADINGEQARVTYTYSDPAIDQDQEPWALEGGAWHQDDC